MATALIGQAYFDTDARGALYIALVHFAVGAAQQMPSTVTVLLGAGDTLATLQTKLLSAIDTEATRLGVAAPTAVYGGAVMKLR